MLDRCVGLRGWLSKFLGFDKHSVTQLPSTDDTGNVQISNNQDPRRVYITHGGMAKKNESDS